jgi:hypothetical protein
MTDGRVELVISLGKQNVELDSAGVWKYLGATPFVDSSERC